MNIINPPKNGANLSISALDHRLSVGAKGLISVLTHWPENTKISRKNIMSFCQCGKSKYDRMRSELVDAGYLKIETNYNDQGRVDGSIWSVFNCGMDHD